MDFEDIPDAGDQSTSAPLEFIAPAPLEEEQAAYVAPAPEVPAPVMPAPMAPVAAEPKGFEAFADAEPEDALKIFTKAWNAKLDIKRAQEAEHEKAVKAQAVEDLANWTQQREIRLKAKKEKNRSEEQVLLETLESEADSTNTWERVTKMIDANTGDAAEAGKADVSRMRKLFIQLKSEPLEKSRAHAVKA